MWHGDCPAPARKSRDASARVARAAFERVSHFHDCATFGADKAMSDRARNAQPWSQVCTAFIRVLEQNRDCAAARSGLGLGLVALGDAEEGLAQLQHAGRIQPTPDHVCNLAWGFLQSGRHAEAELLLRGVLDTVPQHQEAQAALAALQESHPPAPHQ